MAASALTAIVAARNEADRIGATVSALRDAFPGVQVIVADDASEDGTAGAAREAGAQVVSGERSVGKGGNVNRAVSALLAEGGPQGRVVLLCDGDLAGSAAELPPLVEAVENGSCDLAVAAFARRVGGGFGIALRFARWAIERLCGYRAGAPISGQRALSAQAFRAVVPFAEGYGMEIGMTVDAVRAGYVVRELELPLAHRATTRNLRGFLHRGRQLRDFVRVYLRKR
ncbi:MAG TPA: glycosyltransferase family 2 protein [Solirubrobacterales bacterium]